MNWLANINDALKYIEDHLMEPLDSEEIARVAMSSRFHFLRSFYILTGMNLSDYIRQRRLSVAANELLATDQKIIDIAFKCGYERPEAFTKAFKKAHGITPTQARKTQVGLKAFPPLSFHITVKGEKPMEYRIVERESFKVTGVLRSVTSVDGENFKIIPAFWNEVMVNGMFDTLMTASKGGCLGICMNFDQEAQKFDYLIAIEGEEVVEGTVLRDIPAASWAVFKCVGPLPEAIQEVTRKIYSEWFPATGFKHSGGPELEVYLEGDTTADDYVCEVWIPVIKK